MSQSLRITTTEGPSANNQTSEDHAHDSNQAARQPTTQQVIQSEGLDQDTSENTVDIGSANID